MEYKHIELESQKGMVTLWLNRTKKRNAFDNQMISEIKHALQKINQIEEDIILVIRGRGDMFCSGADLDWMQRAVDLSPDANYLECLNLTQFLFSLYSCNKVTLAVVHGAAFGGGIGLAAACDLAFCADETRFSLSELRMGLVASSISPYILKKLGESRTKELIFTSRQFNGKEAESYGLINRSVPLKELEVVVNEYILLIQKGGFKARMVSKNLIHQISPIQITTETIEKTARLLADVRISKEAQDRMKSYLYKVKL